ncbi:hypothetical protein [Burkholderia ubonensis]|nr:hypothetical protein [Burkholderia ubonensis]
MLVERPQHPLQLQLQLERAERRCVARAARVDVGLRERFVRLREIRF